MSGPTSGIAVGEDISDGWISAVGEWPFDDFAFASPAGGVDGGSLPVEPGRLRVDRCTPVDESFAGSSLPVVDAITKA